MPALKHVHMYERVGPREKPKYWRCFHPDCYHRIPPDDINGKRSMCVCGKTFIIDPGAKQRRMPKCLDCRNTAEGRQHRKISNILGDIFNNYDVSKETPDDISEQNN